MARRPSSTNRDSSVSEWPRCSGRGWAMLRSGLGTARCSSSAAGTQQPHRDRRRWRPGARASSPRRRCARPRRIHRHEAARRPVLVVGGSADGRALRSAELFDPAAGRFVATGSLRVARPRTRRRCCPTDACWSREAARRARASSQRSRSGAPAKRPFLARHSRCSSGGTSMRRKRSAAESSSSVGPTSATSPDADPRPSSTGPRSVAGCASGRSRRRASSSATRSSRFPEVVHLWSAGARPADRYDPSTRHDSDPLAGTGRTLSRSRLQHGFRDGGILVVGGYDDRIALAEGAWLLLPPKGGARTTRRAWAGRPRSGVGRASRS